MLGQFNIFMADILASSILENSNLFSDEQGFLIYWKGVDSLVMIVMNCLAMKCPTATLSTNWLLLSSF
jgi:hypothetical protein